MTRYTRIYLDNAATSWPKPTQCYDIVDEYQRRLGVSAGRGGYAEAEEVCEAVRNARAAAARLIGAEDRDRIIFTHNGTDSLNLAIHGVLKPGDHVVTTVVEHNSVLHPLRRLEKHDRVEVTRVGCNEFGIVDPEDIRAAIRPDTKLIVVIHASNVTGALQPVTKIGKIAHEYGILFLVDAAQSLGHIPWDVSEVGADLLAAPGHKGLLGPLGTGILYIRPGIEKLVDCVRQGGTGSASSSDDQPETLPEKYESGSHNAPGIIGLGAGIEYLKQRGLSNIRQHEIDLSDQLWQGLSGIPGVTVYGPRSSADRIGVVSLTFADQDAPTAAKLLEEEFRVQVRGGFQCAALMHRSLGTFERQGTVRFSVGPFNTTEDVEVAVEAARTIAGSPKAAVESVSCPCVAAVHPHDQRTPDTGLVLPATAENGSPAVLPSAGTDVTDIPGLRGLWNETLGDPRVCIAVLDGPVDLTHPAFANSKLKVLGTGDAGADAATEHGTHIASVIFGHHQSPVKGIAPQCSGVVIPIYRTRSDGTVEPCSQSDLAKSIDKAVDYSKQLNAKALVINVSGGQFSESGEAQSALRQAVAKCNMRGILVVAAAGNEGCDCLHVPGALPSVLTVGAMSSSGEPLEFSNWGKKYIKQGVLAIGENILGASPSGHTAVNSGTSFATPIVSGVAALLLSMQLKSGIRPSASEVRQAIVTSALGCDIQEANDCRRLLAGRLSIPHSIKALRLGEPATMTESFEVKDSPEAVTSSCSTNETPSASTPQQEPEPLVVPARASLPLEARAEVTPSSCGCVGNVMTPVFAIGRLTYDFDSIIAQQSMFRRMNEEGESSRVFMRHLFRTNPDGSGKKAFNLHEARRVYWVLEYNNRPMYVIRPMSGATEAEDLRSIAYDYMEQEGMLRVKEDEAGVEIQTLLLGDPEKEKTEKDERPDNFAIPGWLSGETVTLLDTDEPVRVLVPEYDLTLSWNVQKLLDDAVDKKIIKAGDDEAIEEFRMLVDQYQSFIDSEGDTSEKRARNFVVTQAIRMALGSITKPSKLNLVLTGLDVIGTSKGRYSAQEFQLVKATYIDLSNPKDIHYSRTYEVDVSEPFPYLVDESRLGFA